MCKALVPVAVREIVRVPYGSGSGRLRWNYGLGSTRIVMLRCAHDMSDEDFELGYDRVDEFGRLILCSEHCQSEGGTQ